MLSTLKWISELPINLGMYFPMAATKLCEIFLYRPTKSAHDAVSCSCVKALSQVSSGSSFFFSACCNALLMLMPLVVPRGLTTGWADVEPVETGGLGC